MERKAIMPNAAHFMDLPAKKAIYWKSAKPTTTAAYSNTLQT